MVVSCQCCVRGANRLFVLHDLLQTSQVLAVVGTDRADAVSVSAVPQRLAAVCLDFPRDRAG
jgi:hypothetical protein